MRNLGKNKILWFATTFLTLAAAVLGIAIPNFYGKVLTASLIPAGYAQDLLTILVCLVLFWLIFMTKECDLKRQVMIIGIIGSFFYLYGIFSIERVYNIAYYLYLAIFSLSFWSLIYSLASIKGEVLSRIEVSKLVRYLSACFSILIATLFSILWISALFPLISEGKKIEFFYSIYLLDLCFVMPAFIIIAVMVLKKRGLGLLLSPAIFILGIFVILPLGLGELAKPFYGMPADTRSMIMSFLLSGLFAAMAFVHLGSLKMREGPSSTVYRTPTV
jgi:hypothetical protein